jgi:hypothetical protein
MPARNLYLRSRNRLNAARRAGDYEKLVGDLSDVSLSRYLTSNFDNAAGGRYMPSSADLNAARYAISLIHSTHQRDKVGKFRELMYLRARGQDAKYANIVLAMENELIAQRKHATRIKLP